MLNRTNCSHTRREGFTLVEVLVAMAIFAIASAGIITGILNARRMAENNVWFITAATVAQGYIEQMRHMEYAELGMNPIPTKLDHDDPDPLVPDEWNLKLIDLYDTPDNPADDLRMWIMPIVNEVTSSDRRYEISLRFRWEAPAPGGGLLTHENRIDFIRAYVPSF